MKKKYALIFIFFLCAFVSAFGQTTIAIQDFEVSPAAPTMTFTGGSNATGNGAFPNSPKYVSGTQGRQVNNTTQTILFNTVNASAFSNIFFTCRLASFAGTSGNGADGADEVYVDISTDSGSTWSRELEVQGNSNAKWSFVSGTGTASTNYDGNNTATIITPAGGGNRTTDGYSIVTVNNIPNSPTLRVRLVINNNSANEYWVVDDAEIKGTPSCTPPANPVGTISGITPACNSTTLSFAGTPPVSVVYYWQTTASGTSTANNATGTFNATTSGTYYITAFDTVATCWSTGNLSYNVVIDSSTPVITTQPTDQNEVIPNTATFSVVATSNSTETYQWQVNTGTGWNNVSTGTGGTTNSYITPATIGTMDGDQYRCEITNICGTTTSNVATLNLSNNSPNNAQNLDGCFLDNSVTLTWNNPATPPTGGYVIFARNDMTQPTVPPNDANTYIANSNFNAAPFETPASLGKVIYKGNGTTANITGLTEGTTYTFRIFAYNGETLTGWSNGTSGGSNLEDIAQADISNLVATPLTNQVTLNWSNPTPVACWDQLIIVANQGAVVFTPTGDGSLYSGNDNDVYASANQLVYETTGNVTTKAITGLTNGLNYCFRVFIRRGTTWTSGVEVCATPVLTYCDSFGNGADGYLTLIRNVEFNTINNPSSNTDNDYTDYTAMSTTVTLGDTHNLTVHVNTDEATGNFTTTTRAWIDWNNDGDFNGSNEVYELGNAFNVANGATDLSPLAIEVPTNAVIGSTRMRISTKFNTTAATSCENPFDGEVEDYTINIIQPTGAEINIKGNNITIANGFNAPYGLNNTLFGAVDVGGPFNAAKTYTVENIGAAALTLSGSPRVEIIGTNGTANTEFTVTQQPGGSIASSGTSTFDIQFTPSADGLRTATVRIVNSDSNEDPYEFDIEGTATCSMVLTSTIWPIEGPENTEVTITSATSLTGATADINGVNMPIVSTSPTELIVTVPAGTSTGNLSVNFSTGCSSTNTFTIIEAVISGCENGASTTTPTDLFMSELSDATSGSSSYIEIYNGTGSAIDLSDYDIKIYNNGSNSASSTNSLIGTLASGAVYLVTIGTTSCTLNGLSFTPNQTFNSSGGINFNINSSDAIILEKTTGANQGEKDVFGVKGSNTWANGLSFGTDGVNFRRKNDAPNLPTTTFVLADWDIIDWTTCGDSSYSDFGIYDFSLGIPPNITLQPIAPISNCDLTASLTVNATEGVVMGLSLAYQWYVLAPNQTTWSLVTNGALYNNAGTNTLQLLNMLNLDGYQYYCQVRENTVTCYTASNAIKLTVQTTEWDGTSWSDGIPDINTIATISGNYDTSIGGVQDSFSACQLIVNATYTLTIADNTFVEVENDVTVDGSITVTTQGAFVQRGAGVAAGVYTNNGTSTVMKTTATFDSSVTGNYNYTYWSSPVVGVNVTTVFPNPIGNRRFLYQAENYLDATAEVGNNNATVAGQDDIDDNADDWQNASGIMDIGRGYAVTAVSGPPMPGLYSDSADFIGEFNTGDVLVNVYKNDSEAADNNWNFIGNPYPSAIDVNLFFIENLYDISTNPTGKIEGALYFWSQGSSASSSENGNEGFNFNQNDYAVLNGVMGTAGTSLIIPQPYIPSGQGFFVSYDNVAPATSSSVNSDGHTISENQVRFTNSMRVTGNNTQFFRVVLPNKLWLNLTSDNGVFSQIGLGYVSGATDGYDGMYYDAPRNLSTGAYSILYSIIEDNDDKYAIQGKEPSSLDLDEIIPLGFYTSINQATLYTISIDNFEGDFFDNNAIYVKDILMNIVHNLSDSDYTFTSDVGEFNQRFEIVFNSEALSVGDNELNPKDLRIVELNNGDVEFSIGNNFQIKTVEIIDLLGRTIYKLTGNSNREVYNLSNLSSATYIAKVELSNGQIITKKAIKRK